jgi:hypothetical protein
MKLYKLLRKMEIVTAELKIRDLWIMEIMGQVPVVELPQIEITDRCLTRWATEICTPN